MKPGRELDALVAQKVLGCEVKKNSIIDYQLYTCCCPGYLHAGVHQRGYANNELAEYSTDIAAAWEIADKVRQKSKFIIEDENTEWAATFAHKEREVMSWGYTAPHAICLAAIKFLDNKI